MATQALSFPQSDSRSAAAQTSGLVWHVFESLDSVAQDWLALEEFAVLTPYQRLGWIRQYLQSGFVSQAEIRILVLRDVQANKTVALLPLEIVGRFGIKIARVIGMPIANADSVVFDPAYADQITPATLHAALQALHESGTRVDIANFHCFTANWQGVPNPLMKLPHSVAPNHLYLTELEPGDKPYIEQRLPHKRRTNVRRSRRRLTEQFGELSLMRATSAEQAQELYDIFLDQRGRRFSEMGVVNIFAEPTFRKQLLGSTIECLNQEHPTVTIHALKAGDNVLAISIGARSNGHYSQYINSTTYGEAAKYSLMGVLMSLLVEELRCGGVVSLDMGLGDFDYKTDWTRKCEVYDAVVPVSAVGSVVGPGMRLVRRAKRAIKQSPTVWKLVRPLLALKTRLKPES